MKQTAGMKYHAATLFMMVNDAILPADARTVTVRKLNNGSLVIEVYADGESETGAKQYRLPAWPREPFEMEEAGGRSARADVEVRGEGEVPDAGHRQEKGAPSVT